MKFLHLASLPPALLACLLAAPTPVHALDSDDDGVPNKFDECKKDPEDMDGHEDNDGCPDPDNDKDGVCDAFVAERGEAAKYAAVCKGTDKCVEVPEDKDGFEDGDGCPDPDNDKDGIPDVKDRCPMAKEDMDGFEDNDGCLDPDNDADGVLDGSDKCVAEAEDKDGFEDEDGCPDLDNDKDGLKDEVDKCPNEPETVNAVDDEDGCPDKAMPAFQPVQVYPLVKFRSGTAELTVEAEQPLELLAKQLKEYPEKAVEIRLYTWYKGKKKEEYLKLLEARSKAVVDFLVEKGVDPSQLKVVDYTLENFEALKGTEKDFNQEKPMEVYLQN